MNHPPLIVHVIHHLRVGGLENGLVNLINRLPPDRFQHAVICIDDYSDFRNRLVGNATKIYALRKAPGKSVRVVWDLYILLRKLRPEILHSRNLAGLDSILPAWLAGVRCRIHGEHGRDVNDLKGENKRFRFLRRLHRPLINRFVPLSKDLERYLVGPVGVSQKKIRQIYNGVDTSLFRPRQPFDGAAVPASFAGSDTVLIGTVGRLQAVKNQILLVEAFHRARILGPDIADRLRLVIVGDGPESSRIHARIEALGLKHVSWLPGTRHDVPEILRQLDVFVLPSLAEGISNTILESMASGVPVIATAVGGNAELVNEGESGYITPSQDPDAIALKIIAYVRDEELRRNHAAAAATRARELFDLERMIGLYAQLYDEILADKGLKRV